MSVHVRREDDSRTIKPTVERTRGERDVPQTSDSLDDEPERDVRDDPPRFVDISTTFCVLRSTATWPARNLRSLRKSAHSADDVEPGGRGLPSPTIRCCS